MRLRHLVTLAPLAALLLTFGCSSDDGQSSDPCRGVVCHQGQDCQAGVCVDRKDPEPEGCTSNNDCQFDPRGRLCETSTGRCVACQEDAHCFDGRTCEVGTCVGTVCTTDGDCAEPTPVCAEDGRSCIECRDDAGCGEGRLCKAGVCEDAPCRTDDDCADEVDTPRCQVSTGACVACLDEGDCAEGEVCAEGVCAPRPGCHSDADCEGDPEGGRCETGSGTCVACLDAADCGFAESCVGHVCRAKACEETLDCPPGALCADDVCQPLDGCGSDADCAADPRVPRCGAAGACVACTSDADCGGGRCVNEACVAPEICTSDAQCKGGFVCTGGGCAACRTDEQCPRGACRQGACVDRATCAKDADCAEGRCVAGACTACGTDLDCRPGLWCEGGGCVEPTACASDAECGPNRLCDGVACLPAGCTDDTLEPDGGAASARPVGLGAPVSRVLCPNDEDWIAFTAAARSALDVSLLNGPPDLDFSLVWFEPGDERIRHERAAAKQRLMIPSLPSAAAGRYFLRVHGKPNTQGAYTLMPKVGTTACTDPFEPNNAWGQASLVPTGTMIEGLTLCDTDFYSFDVPANHTLAAYALYGDGDVQLSLFDDRGQPQSGSRVSPTTFLGGGTVVEWNGTTTDTRRLVRVMPFSPSTGKHAPSSYRIFVAVVPKLSCGEEPVLVELGADRARLVDSTLGRAASTAVSACGAVGPEGTWSVDLDEPSRLVARIAGGYDAIVSLRDASCTAEQSCMTSAGGTGALDLPRLEAGSYVLAVGGPAGQAGPFDLALRRLDPVDPPANDHCSAPIDLAIGADTLTVAGTTEGAGPSPAVAGLCQAASPDVFYSFTLAAGARVVAEVTADQAVSLSLLDDACQPDGGCGTPGRKQRIDRSLGAGTHILRVASVTGAATPFTLKVTAPAALSNDTCAGAVPLTFPANVPGDTTWATNQLSFPLGQSCTGYYLDGGDLFYAMDLSAGQRVSFALTPGYDAALYVIGDCAAPACLAGVDQPGRVPESLTFTAPVAGRYHLVVDGASGGGSFTLTATTP